MPAPKRIPDQQVVEAIQKWRGNVAAAAERLGIAPVNLRKRLDSLGIELSFLRDAERYRMGGTEPKMPHRNPLADTQSSGKQNSRGIFPASARRSTLLRMETESATADAITAAPKMKVKPVRLGPDQQERLREAKFDLQARYRVDLDETAILEQFFADRFEEWMDGRLKAAEKAKGGK